MALIYVEKPKHFGKILFVVFLVALGFKSCVMADEPVTETEDTTCFFGTVPPWAHSVIEHWCMPHVGHPSDDDHQDQDLRA